MHENVGLTQQNFILKYNIITMQPRRPPSLTPFKCHPTAYFQEIVKKDTRIEKTAAYSIQEKSSEGTVLVLKYVLPMSELLLLNLMRLLELKIMAVYQNCLKEGEKYFAEVLSVPQATAALQKLYHWDDFSKIDRFCSKLSDPTTLPEYVWVRQINDAVDVSNFKKELRDYDINYAQLDHSFLLQKSQAKRLECEVVIQALRRKKSTSQTQIGILSNGLFVQLDENDNRMRQKYSYLETEINAISVYRCQDTHCKVRFVFELKDILNLLEVRSTLFTRKIQSQLLPWDLFLQPEQIEQTSNWRTIDLQVISSQLRKGDILDFERHLNSPNSQLAKQVDFALKEWDHHQLFLEEKMQALQHLLMSYQHDPQEVGFTRFTAFDSFAKRVLWKVKALNGYKGNPKQAAREVGLKQNNYIFQNFVRNAISTARKKGEIMIKKEDVTKSLHELIAAHEDFESKSRKATRWEHLFSLIGTSHFLKERQFDQKEMACHNEYMKGIEQQVLLDLSCFGCCPFFYSEQNIRNSEVNTTPFRLISYANDIQIQDNQIKDAMRELMVGQGGVIFFDCVAKNREVLPKGVKIPLERQEEVKTKLTEYFEQLVNNDMDVDILKQISISFVPVFRNPLKHRLKNGKRSLIDQTYVTRVKIDRVWNKRNLSEQEQREMIFFGPKICCFHSGPCSEPYQQEKKEKSDRSKKTTKQAPPPTPYKFKSLLIWDKKENLDTLRRRLPKQYGEVDIRYQKFNLKCSSNTGLIRHNISFTQLKQFCKQVEEDIESKRPVLHFGKSTCKGEEKKKEKEKMLIVAEIFEMVNLPDRTGRKKALQLQDFLDMTEPDALRKQFQMEEVVLWKYRNKHDQLQYYFQVKDKDHMKIALLYFILRSNSEKARFKLPPDYQKAKAVADLKDLTPVFVIGQRRKAEKQEQLKPILDELRADLFKRKNQKQKQYMTNPTGSV